MVDPRDRRTALSSVPGQVTLAEHASGYFSTPTPDLDPRLFEMGTDHLKPEIRDHTLSLLKGFWRGRYIGMEHWATVWLAGSGVSHQWAAQRDPGDLDTLIGVDFTRFRAANPHYQGWNDSDLADMLNIEFKNGLDVVTANWLGFEQTWYVNATASDIRNIAPYAAYNVSADNWTVKPAEPAGQWDADNRFPDTYWAAVQAEHQDALGIVERYNQANAAGGVNGSFMARTAAKQALALFEDIHSARHRAFSRGGAGYGDYYNFRWQAHKRSGVVAALKEIGATLVDPKAPMGAQEALRLAVRSVQP